MNGPDGLIRRGWKRGALKLNDKVTIVTHPLLSGEPGGSFVSIILPNGEELGRYR